MKFIPTLLATLIGSILLVLSGCDGGQQDPEPKSKTGKAKVGVGKKGEGYGNRVPILKPAATFWRVQEKIAFEIAIPKTLQLFEAIQGRKPKSHDEFMEKIIKEGKIKLPELEEGLEYFYDSQSGELMVRNRTAK